MKNIILFGGAFDPIHNAHLDMAKKASKQLDAEVIFIPAVISVWKSSSVSFQDKVNMIKLAIKDEINLSLSEYESTTGKEVNYTIDTVKYFKNLHKDANLYFLIGGDQVQKFHLWKSADELSKIAKIVFFNRPDNDDTNGNIKKFDMLPLDGVFSYANSSSVRSLQDLDIPESVLNYILDKKLYFIHGLKEYLGDKRLNHSIEVAKLAYKIAKNNAIDASKAFIAGLLHDIGKEVMVEHKNEIMHNFYNEYLDLPEFSYHQFVGEYIAREKFGINDAEILNAIKFHATGCGEMSEISKIIYASDKIEPTRGFDSSELIRVCLNDINKGFQTTLHANKDFLTLTNKDIENRLTKACFDKYL